MRQENNNIKYMKELKDKLYDKLKAETEHQYQKLKQEKAEQEQSKQEQIDSLINQLNEQKEAVRLEKAKVEDLKSKLISILQWESVENYQKATKDVEKTNAEKTLLENQVRDLQQEIEGWKVKLAESE